MTHSPRFEGDLGFTFQTTASGTIEIHHRGRYATRFTGPRASRIITQLEMTTPAKQQHLLARLTGNYKRGNEKRSKP